MVLSLYPRRTGQAGEGGMRSFGHYVIGLNIQENVEKDACIEQEGGHLLMSVMGWWVLASSPVVRMWPCRTSVSEVRRCVVDGGAGAGFADELPGDADELMFDLDRAVICSWRRHMVIW